MSDQTPYLLVNSCLQDEKTLHCILLHIETTKQNVENEKPNLNKPKASLASSILHWITLNQGNIITFLLCILQITYKHKGTVLNCVKFDL